MRTLALALLAGILFTPSAWAKFTGLSLSTSYPDQTVQAGQPAVIPLAIHNFGLGPQLVHLRAKQSASGWKVAFQGNGRDVDAVFVDPDSSESVSLHLTPPADAKAGQFSFDLVAAGVDHQAELPITLHLVKSLPDWLTATASLPTLEGSASTKFTYDVKLRNRSGRDATVNLSAKAPDGFDVTFTPQYGTQQVTAMQVKSGETKDVSVKVDPPSRASAGRYPITVLAAAGTATVSLPLHMVISGHPQLSLSTPTGRLSGNAYVGESTTVALTVQNTGSAPARALTFSSGNPSHWKVAFHPDRIDSLAPQQTASVSADITPSNRSLAGDYMVTFNARGGSDNTSADYRVTVLTPTLWGGIGIAIAAAAILVVGFAIMRFGRR